VIAAEIVENLRTAPEALQSVAAELSTNWKRSLSVRNYESGTLKNA
jgi:hypothetical protein